MSQVEAVMELAVQLVKARAEVTRIEGQMRELLGDAAPPPRPARARTAVDAPPQAAAPTHVRTRGWLLSEVVRLRLETPAIPAPEIAARLGATVGGVKSAIVRAREKGLIPASLPKA